MLSFLLNEASLSYGLQETASQFVEGCRNLASFSSLRKQLLSTGILQLESVFNLHVRVSPPNLVLRVQERVCIDF